MVISIGKAAGSIKAAGLGAVPNVEALYTNEYIDRALKSA